MLKNSTNVLSWQIIKWIDISEEHNDKIRWTCFDYIIKTYILEQWSPIQIANVLQMMSEDSYKPKIDKQNDIINCVLADNSIDLCHSDTVTEYTT